MELIAQSSVDHYSSGHLISNRAHLKRFLKVDISIVKIGANVSIHSVVYVCVGPRTACNSQFSLSRHGSQELN